MTTRTAASAIITLALWAGCRASAPPMPAGAGTRVVTVVAGCPTEEDGTISACQWRRAAWAAALYHGGEAAHFITSGGRAYTPHAEGQALATAMTALGVPPRRITLETQALHTDQNMAYSLVLARELGYDALVAVSDPGHAEFMCSLAHRWRVPCEPRPLEQQAVSELLAEAPRDLRVPGMAQSTWISQHREPRMATSSRYNSFGYYMKAWFVGLFRGRRPPAPPAPEPTFRPERS